MKLRPQTTRTPRAALRLGLMAAAALGACTLVVAVLLDEEPVAPRTHVVLPAPPRPRPAAPQVAAVESRRVPLAATPRPAPRGVGDVLRQDAQVQPSELAGWVRDRALAPQARYAALRRLEVERPDEAVTAALAVLDDQAELVRLNAIAVLTRAKDPRAATALAALDDRSRRLATALTRRGS